MTISTKGCTSESGRLRKVVMCPPANFSIVKPINAVQWAFRSDGLALPQTVDDGLGVLCIDCRTVISVAESESVNNKLQ